MSSPLKYPSFDIRLKKSGEQHLVFDPVRKSWCILNPEEWVRQHILHFLIHVKKYPASGIAVEKQIQLNGQLKRFDILVYRQVQPLILIECKAPYITLDNSVVEQALRYNLVLKAEFVMVSNGISDAVFRGNQRIEGLPDFPA
ncbi:MAG TPA: type I restriction enzyme HsdR N-terminal domain-containing protein [Bacteroidia bacterium]|nr:type I restriction enzyme HsdR N-terminal domain-containing protein [Bacteroidia bacterium]